ncbi:ORF6C domain-containing protein [Lacrimispora sp. 38-1]|uniref:ORF6C domain-containing protein n=1 Tax=Lacrimispora sp. 38-1 TaxID=3125778 RepID=UPI003CE888E8
MNDLKVFKNEELGLQVRTIMNPDGSISVSAEDTAIGFGWIQEKSGKTYVRWETMNAYCKELKFSQDVGKDDYIPESLYYLLGMKASNEKAQKYQRWLAMDVIPSLRKNGHYEMPNMSRELQAIIMIDKKQVQMENRMDKLEFDIPLYGAEADELSNHIKRKGVKVLGGKQSEAYKDTEIRSKVYRDIYDQIKREFGIYDDSGRPKSYKALKRKYIADAHELIDCYEAPTYLVELIETANAQMNLGVA